MTLRDTFARTLHQMEAKHCYEMQVFALTSILGPYIYIYIYICIYCYTHTR